MIRIATAGKVARPHRPGGVGARADRARMAGMTAAELRKLGMKRCTGCGRVKPRDSAFSTMTQKGKTYPRPRCKACDRIALAGRRSANPGAEYARRFGDAPDRVARRRELQAAYRRKHPEKGRAYRASLVGGLRRRLASERWYLRARCKTDRSRDCCLGRIAALEAEVGRIVAARDAEGGGQS